MGGFVQPWALLALPLAIVPFLLERVARRREQPVPFSSLYLLERGRREHPPQRISPARWTALLRALAIAALVLAAARPVATADGGPAAHLPTRAVIAVDVSASVRQTWEGKSAWEAIRATADTLLALSGPDDRIALAAIADRIVGWWEGSGPRLRQRLATVEPTARPSDWPAALAALDSRLDVGTEAYLLTDGARGARGPTEDPAADRGPPSGYRGLWLWDAPEGANRALAGTVWPASGLVAITARGWGEGVADVAVAGRAIGARIAEEAPIAVERSGRTPGGEARGEDGSLSSGATQAWTVADTATFAFREADRHPFDDRRWVASGRSAAEFRVTRWTPPDEPPEPGSLFWEAALAVAARGARIERAAGLGSLAARPPDLALLPVRAYPPDQAALLGELARQGTRLLFAPTCADPACVPPPGWLRDPELAVPDLEWSMGSAERQGTLAPRPEGAPGPGLPEHLVAEVPVRGVLRAEGGAAPDVVWRLTTGAPAFWARGPVAIWLVPFGPPATRLGTTPVFPLVADVALASWHPRWGAGGADSRPGEPLPAPAGATVTGPLGGDRSTTWVVAPGAPPPRPEQPGLYRIDLPPDVRGEGEPATFVAVNADAAEGDLRPIPAAAWRAAWGVAPTPAEAWRAALFPRRRGPELWPWALVLALTALAAEAAARRTRFHK